MGLLIPVHTASVEGWAGVYGRRFLVRVRTARFLAGDFSGVPGRWPWPLVVPLVSCSGERALVRRVVVGRLLAVDEAGTLTSVHARIAAETAGVSVRTVWRWLAEARQSGRVEAVPCRGGFSVTEELWVRFSELGGNVGALHQRRTPGAGSRSRPRTPPAGPHSRRAAAPVLAVSGLDRGEGGFGAGAAGEGPAGPVGVQRVRTSLRRKGLGPADAVRPDQARAGGRSGLRAGWSVMGGPCAARRALPGEGTPRPVGVPAVRQQPGGGGTGPAGAARSDSAAQAAGSS